MFGKYDFNSINHIEFNENFNINLNNSSKVIFGYNGIGKSSIYKYLKENYQEYDFLDYDETKNSFLKSKKEVIIGAKIYSITKLNDEIQQLIQNIGVESILKKYKITNRETAKKIGDEVVNIQRNKAELFDRDILEKIDNVKYIENVLYEDIKKEFFYNYQDIKMVNDKKKELELLKNVYMNDAYQALLKSIDKNTTTCPTCNTTGIHNLKEIIEEKQKT